MAKNKKPKKKYTPRTVYYPKIIIAMQAIDPIEKALDNLLEKGEILEDSDGVYVYKSFDGQMESFEAGLDIYTKVIQKALEVRQSNTTLDLSPLLVLRQAMIDQENFSESNILESKKCLELCKEVINQTAPKLIRELASMIGEQRLGTNILVNNQES